MAREIILDTETTGFDPKTGDRVVEIACVEVEDFLPTGRHFHCYINPERDMPAEAERIHGLSAAFLADMPVFAHESVCEAFLAFVGEATLVAHNAGFDRNFVNAELALVGRDPLHEARWVDTLGLAQKRFPGMSNSLDALCRRFKISLAEREKHGALIDAKLLAHVYLELRGGREASLDLASGVAAAAAASRAAYPPRPRPLVGRVTLEEAARHAAFVAELPGGGLWVVAGAAAGEDREPAR
ncbi:MAG TPA: DNA polymerase III subunit epsilon [Caulobacteraceae bacterium]|jgi:DNA polymerase-3 subunit epsilon|nr:DNA polymerase III subunit epsilon [Caulobacteraceae bacterium]